MSTDNPTWQFNVDDFLRMSEVGIFRSEDNVELVEGQVLAMPDRSTKYDSVVPWQFTVDDFLRMGETGIIGPDRRVELVEGEVRQMSPIGAKHASASAWLTKNLTLQLGDLAIVSSQNPVQLTPYSELQPDVMVTKNRDDFYSSQKPGPTDTLLIIEVSDSSLNYDRGKKKRLYAQVGIADYWLVDLLKKRLFWYSQPHEGEFQQLQEFSASDLVQIALAGHTLELDFSKILS